MLTINEVINHINEHFPKFKKAIGLNQSQSSELIGVAPSTLERWRVDATGPEYIKTPNGKKSRIIYTKKALAEFIVSNQVKTL